ncbi:hypothetical protein SETIT_1G019000v2 [Setaria italica]|uniref:Uncharacterized protein n=2 Tax=Setaria TaxID=4554 RepID=A0A368PFV2_SETIT|nr:hypothetical protein SETIT_1G019000v2 [Setaria italica]TKW36998.1 hypothetical protein SEVIR_1G018700v2 [Setaria viridis]
MSAGAPTSLFVGIRRHPGLSFLDGGCWSDLPSLHFLDSHALWLPLVAAPSPGARLPQSSHRQRRKARLPNRSLSLLQEALPGPPRRAFPGSSFWKSYRYPRQGLREKLIDGS